MAISADELEAVFFASFSVRQVRHLHRAVTDSYRLAFEERLTHHDGPEGEDLLGNLRRGHLDRLLRGMGDLYESTIRTESRLNTQKNCHYTELSCGRVVLTASATEGRNQVPRSAVFRTHYAQGNQTDFFRPNNPPGQIYALLYHVPDDADEAVPFAVMIGFPDPSPKANRFIHTIDLGRHLSSQTDSGPMPSPINIPNVER